jgi:hypothetical protein
MIDGIKVIEKKFVPLLKEYMVKASASAYDHYLKIVSTEVIESKLGNDEYADYIAAEATKDAMVRIKYQVLTREGDKLMHTEEAENGILVAEFYIPVTIHNLFIIDGKVRAPLNYVSNVNECVRYGASRLALHSGLSIDYEKGVVNYASDGNYYHSEAFSFDQFSSKIPTQDLKLSDSIAKRLFVQYPLDTIPTYLTRELIEQLRQPPTGSRDHITRKKLISVYDALYIHLDGAETRRSIMMKTKNRFNKLKKYYDSTLNSSIRSFFKGQSEYLTGLQNESNTNPATYETLSNKVILEKYSQGCPAGAIPQTDYNESLALLVDPSMTPDSMNVNRINEMNHSVTYDGFDTYIAVIDLKTGDQTKLELLDYMCQKVLTSHYYDYTKRELKQLSPNDDVWYRFKGNYVKMAAKDVKADTFRYVDTPSDDRLSRSTRMIPNTNYSDSVRTSMGSRMGNQSIATANAEPPMVTTGHKDYKNLSLFVRHSGAGGVITEIDDVIKVKQDDGKEVIYRIPENMQAQYNINVSFELNKKVGDRVEEGDTIIKPLGVSTEGEPLLGYNAFVAFANYEGYTYEDGAVISQSFANKMTHTYILDIEERVLEVDTLHGITALGTPLKARDLIARITRKKSASAQVRQITNIFFPEEDQKLEFDENIICPDNVYEGYLVDFNYSKGGAINEEAEKMCADYKRNKPRRIQLPFNYHYNHIKDESADPKETYALKLKFRIVVRAAIQVGDKLSNRYGSKGVVTKILPDSEMWRTESGRIFDCILNPFAVISRKNVSQTMEAGLTLVADAVYRRIKEKNLLDDPTKLRETLREFKFDDYLDIKSDSELTNKIIQDKKLYYTVGCYGRISPKEIADMLDKLDLSDGKVTVYKGNGKPLRNKVVAGYQYMMKLQFLVTYSNKVTSDDHETDSMVLGYGAEKDSGQSLEEMIFWALQSHGASKAINTFRETSGRVSELWLRAHILTAGLDISEKSIEDVDKL